MTGNIILDIVIVIAMLGAILCALKLGGVIDFSGFGVRLRASGRSGSRMPSIDLLRRAKLRRKVGTIIGQERTDGGATPPTNISIGHGAVLEGSVDKIVGQTVGPKQDGARE